MVYVYNVVIDRIIDGDTLDVTIDLGFKLYYKQRVRLSDINTPEVFGASAVPAGLTAKEFTTNWFIGGQKFVLCSKKYDSREKYGRILGEFFRDTDPISLNQALFKAGLAVLSKY